MLEELFIVYYGVVGGNVSFLFNLLLDMCGFIYEWDVEWLQELGDVLCIMFQENLVWYVQVEVLEMMDE